MKKYLPYGRQSITNKDISSVKKILKSDFLTTGPTIKLFEKSLSKFCRSKFAVAVNSATSALHIACLSLGIKKGDIVWTSPISFVASANCAIYCGAKIDFVDIDINSFNISIENLKKKLILAKKGNKLPKVIIPVHLAGYSCEMKEIYSLSKKYGFKIIEDASHGIGGIYNKMKIGSCYYSDIAIFSFHPVKIITSGEGGVAMTNNKKLMEKMKLFREHGINKNFNTNKKPWYYQQQDLGFNYRMSDIHAALGLSQLKKINKFIKRRNLISKYYKSKLKNLPITFQETKKNIYSTFHLFLILVPKLLHLDIFKFLRKHKILINLHYIPIFLHPFYSKKNLFKIKDYPNSINYYNRAISLPIFYDLKKKDQDKVINLIQKYFKKNN